MKKSTPLGTATTAAALCLCIAIALGGCATSTSSSSAAASSAGASTGASASASASAASTSSSADSASTSASTSSASTASYEAIADSSDGGHAIEADGTAADYSNIAVTKTGNSDGEKADFYGENSAIFATNGATLTISNATIDTDGTHANAVFSYGKGTTINISDSVINTSSNTSGGLMTTGGGTMNATNLTVHTLGRSSAAIRSDRGGGTVTVTGGSYTAEGSGSPAIYSTADITVNDATLESTSAQGVVIEGKNSVTLNNVDLMASNVKKNSDKSAYFQGVMIYQSMSGDASVGTAEFTMNDGTLVNKNGDIFFVNNTSGIITLNGATITNEDASGVFLRAAAAGWGKEGRNGGHVTLNASSQVINGNMLVDSISSLALSLADGSTFTGAINPDGQEGDVNVTLTGGSTWKLTSNSYITSLDASDGTVDLNGYTLYVNGTAWSA